MNSDKIVIDLSDKRLLTEFRLNHKLILFLKPSREKNDIWIVISNMALVMSALCPTVIG